MAQSDHPAFSGSIPKLYERYLVPLIFEPYARDLVERLKNRALDRVLEIAAGTGVVTRQMATVLPASTAIVATDLNPGMVEVAEAIGTARPVQWQAADAMALPFPDQSFDAVVCQFGAMFFPDKPAAYAEVRRVLRPGGLFLFNVWDRLAENEFPNLVTKALATLFPDDPPRFMARTPYGYHCQETLRQDLAAGGFAATADIDTVSARSRAASPRIAAVAFCQGTPLRNEIEARELSLLGRATDLVEAALANRFGSGAVDGRIQAHVIAVER